MATLIMPSIHSCLLRVAETERRMAAMRCIEAIRLYAAQHDGRLPKRLDEIEEVPVPVNPVTGKPFGYRLEGETAVLEADGPPDGRPRRYRVKLAK